MAGIQLTKGNTGIADLSDANRPTNLAEKWSALYTDEWSDAFDELQKDKSVKNKNFEIEKELCSIATNCYKICNEVGNKQIVDIKKHLWDTACCLHQQPEQLVSSATTTQYHKFQPKDDTRMNERIDEKVMAVQQCTEELIQIVHERRKYDKKLLQFVIQKAVQHYENYTKPVSNGKIINFIKRCTELCWSMVIKEPPMVLLYDQMEGKPIDRNTYSVYTKNGTTIDFVVWPALFLHIDGPILSKGVVQGRDVDATYNSKQDVTAIKSTDSPDASVKSTNTLTDKTATSTRTGSPTGNSDVSTKAVTSFIKTGTSAESRDKSIGRGTGKSKSTEGKQANLSISSSEKQGNLSTSVTEEQSNMNTFIKHDNETRQADYVQGLAEKQSNTSSHHTIALDSSKGEQDSVQNSVQDKLPESSPFREGDTIVGKRFEQ